MKKNLLRHNVFFWDFDGVIIDSDQVRKKAFEDALSEYEDIKVKKLIEFHNKNGGLSRYIKLDYFFDKILKKTVSQNHLSELLSRYGEYCSNQLINNKYLFNETINFIKQYSKSKIFYIASGSDNVELNFLCKKLNIQKYFSSINGSPESKKDIVKRIINKHNYDLEKTCLIGNSVNDYEAAHHNKINFFGYNNTLLADIKGTNYIEKF
jgi:phosphoglycolate phosphatase-like HAD superfamily hydrolase